MMGIWENAPQGADYYVEDWGFFKFYDGEWWVASGLVWHRTPYKSPENFSWFGAAVKRPPPAWSGEGLPPVGEVCEYNASSDREKGKELWCEVVIKYLSDWVIVFACTKAPVGHEASVGVELFGDISDRIEKRFRPIRTPEQIAADEREAAFHTAICDVEEKVAKWNTTIDCSAAIKATVDIMISMGYRK